MAMPVPMPTFTVDEVRAFPSDGCRYELVNGMLLVTPQPLPVHQMVALRLSAALADYLGTGGPGIVVTPGEIEVRPSLHMEPDILVFPARFKAPGAWTEITGWWLAVEVFSRSSRRYDRDYKRDAYLALGVREVWLVDLDEKCVLVSRQGAPRDVRHAQKLTWHPLEMPQPLNTDLTKLFRDFQ